MHPTDAPPTLIATPKAGLCRTGAFSCAPHARASTEKMEPMIPPPTYTTYTTILQPPRLITDSISSRGDANGNGQLPRVESKGGVDLVTETDKVRMQVI